MIDQDVAQRVLGLAMRSGGDFAELYAEDRRSTSASLDDGRIEQVSSGRDRGAGIRVVSGDTTGFAHTSDLSEGGLRLAAEAAAAAARQGAGTTVTVEVAASSAARHSAVAERPGEIPKGRKVELLQRANEAARAHHAAIVQVSAGYSDSAKRILIANSDGMFVDDEVVRCHLRVSAVADGDAGMQTGYESIGQTIGFELFDAVDVTDIATTAARRAVVKLDARPAPSGQMPVVIAAGSGGVLFHEACGHGLEADLVSRGASVYRGRVSELVASPLVTVVDDGTIPGEWGTRGVDDEGTPTRRNVLIQDGVLTDFMWDRTRSRESSRSFSGNGRRESYRHLPMVRMTNTLVAGGETDADEIIAATESGVYVAKLGGGSVNTANGDFVFGTVEAYLIEDGQITAPLRDGNLVGNGPQCLADIDLVGNDFTMGGPGTCGKDGQGVPVGMGTPTLRVAALTIGGTAA